MILFSAPNPNTRGLKSTALTLPMRLQSLLNMRELLAGPVIFVMTICQKWQLLKVQGSSVEKRKVFMVWMFL